MKINREELIDILKKSLVFCISIAFYYVIFNFQTIKNLIYTIIGYSKPIIFGFFIAFIINMIMNQFEKLFFNLLKFKSKKLVKFLSLILSLLLGLLIAIFVIFFVLPKFIQSLISLLYRLPGLLDQTVDNLSKYKWASQLVINIEQFISDIQLENLINRGLYLIQLKANVFISGTFSIIGVILSSFLSIVLSFSLSIYIILGKDRLKLNSKRVLYATFSEKLSDKIIYLCSITYKNFYNFFYGQFLEAILMGVVSFIGLYFIGTPYALMLAVTAALLNVIPYLGGITSNIISVIIIGLTSPTKALIYYVYIFIYKQIDGNYIYPNLVGSRIGIPAFWMILAITLGGATMGIIGMIIFVPLVSTLYTIVKEFTFDRLKKKNIDIKEK